MEEAFVAHRPAIRLLVVPQRRAALEKLVLHATNLRIPIVEVEGGSLTALAGFDGHQGIALVVEPRRYASLDDILARAVERAEPPFILALDSLEDPHNVGSLLRSAEAAGVHGVLYPIHRQAPLSPSAVKASAGAVEHLLLAPVEDLPSALSDLHARGVRIAGADGDAPLSARQSDLRGPLAIVVGSEGQGLGPAVRRRCDLFMRIPMKGVVGSLNAAVAGSILLFEALAQREALAEAAGSEDDVVAETERRSAVTTPSDETPSDETPSDETPSDATPSDATPSDATPSAETQSAETPTAKTRTTRAPATRTRAARTKAAPPPAAETPGTETPPAGTPSTRKPSTRTRAARTKAAPAPQEPPTSSATEGGDDLLPEESAAATRPKRGRRA